MNKREDFNQELNSTEYKTAWQEFQTMRNCLLHCLIFSYHDTVRDGISDKSNFFLRMVEDISQSTISIETLAKEGIINTCKRELRYLIELAIKATIITRTSTKTDINEQIEEYRNLLNSSNINPLNKLKLDFFTEEDEKKFKTEVKKAYGLLSKFTHSSSEQITERIKRAMSGKTIGFEGTQELKSLNELIEKVFSQVIVFIFNSVPQYVVGDYLVESNGDINNWYFKKSKFISLIDETFDYKHERQVKIEKIRKERKENIK
ncbi:MAG TPA: hypothetical protein PKH16_12745 [Aequorivita sp.]|nr:hypothetical protein [Aequorivita sp.]